MRYFCLGLIETRVVFEFNKVINTNKINAGLIETRVVFEYNFIFR